MFSVVVLVYLSSFFFFLSEHPFHKIFFVVLLALFSALIILKSYLGAWFTYIFVLLFVGGLMVVFVYVSSMVPSEWLNSTMSILVASVFTFSVSGGSSYINLLSLYGVSFFFLFIICLVLYFVFLVVVKVSYNPYMGVKSFF